MWERWDARFPVICKYGGFVGSVAATAAAFNGVDFGVPLLALFGSMMGLGQIIGAVRKGQE